MKRGNSGIVFRANSGWTAKMEKEERGKKGGETRLFQRVRECIKINCVYRVHDQSHHGF